MTTPLITGAFIWPPNPGPITQIQPFTYEDGLTFLEILYALKNYIEKTIVPAINDFDERFQAAIAALIIAIDARLDEQDAELDAKILELTQYVDEQVQAIIDDSIQVQDPVMAGIMQNVASATRLVTDGLYAGKALEATVAPLPARITSVETELDELPSDIEALDTIQGEAVRSAARPSGGMEVRESWTDKPNGSISLRAQTGQVAGDSYRGNSGDGQLRIENGALTTGPAAEGGSYRVVELEHRGISIGATFSFTTYTENGGLLALIFFEGDITAEPSLVPRSPMHFIISPTSWTLQVLPEGSGATTVASATFTTPLIADSVTQHSVNIVHNYVDGSATIQLPNGTTRVVTDVRLKANPAKFSCVEPFRSTSGGNVVNMTRAIVHSWWADSIGVEAFAAAKSSALILPMFSEEEEIDSGFLDISTERILLGTRQRVGIPESGRVLAIGTFYLRTTIAGGFDYMRVRDGGNNTFDVVVREGSVDADNMVTAQWVLEATPGSTQLYVLCGIHAGTGSSSIATKPSNPRRPATLTLIPLGPSVLI